MKMKVPQIFIFCAVLLTLFLSAEITARACVCSMSGTVDVEFERTPNVAVFKLQSIEKRAEGEKGYGVGGIKQSKLTVEKVFKGNLKVGDTLTFAQGTGGDCVWMFGENLVGTEYLFYLSAKPEKGTIWTAGTCSRSNAVKYAAADLLYLEKMKTVRGKTRLYGAVTQIFKPAVEGGKDSHDRLAGRKIQISGNGKNIELKTDENGAFEIYDLPAGKYKLTPEEIEGYQFYSQTEKSVEVEIKDKKHTEENFYFSIDNAIRGRVFDANGKTLENVCLNLLPARGKTSPYFYQADCTDETGAFAFDEIPAGTYIIVVNKDGKISSYQPFGTFYYPSATRREEATEIYIGAGDFREDLIVNAPQTAETITVSGILLFEDGKPAGDQWIKFFVAPIDSEANPYSDAAQAKTKADGSFNIKILKGQKGELLGTMYSYSGEFENCPKLEKILRVRKDSPYLETPRVQIEANSDLSGIELKFPFPSCKKAKIE